MTEEQVRRLVREELAAVQTELRAQAPTQPWLIDGVARAVAEGLTDGSAPLAYCTRGEAMILAANAVKAAKE